MADFSDVMNTLVNICQDALYPAGVGAGSPLGVNFRIYRGSPTANVLDTDLQAGFQQQGGRLVLVTPTDRIVHIRINPRAGFARVLAPYVFAPIQITAPSTATLTATVAGDTVTLGGTIAAGQGAAVAANGFVVGATAGASDTLSTLATAIAAGLNPDIPATAAGAVITIPSATALKANSFVQVGTGQELAREQQGLVITIHAAGRDLRDAVGKALRAYLAGQVRFTLPDGFEDYMVSVAPICVDDDKPSKELNFTRDLYYSVQFPTTDAGEDATLAITQTEIETLQGVPIETVVEA